MRLVRQQRSATVRTIEVAGMPRIVTISSPPRAQRRTAMPTRDETPSRSGTVTSTGLHGSTSIPCNHAAVKPENAPPGGSRKDAARSVSHGLRRRLLETYVDGPRRDQFEPSSCQRRKPARSASSIVNGPLESAGGMDTLRVTKQQSAVPSTLGTLLANPRVHADAGFLLAR